MTQQALDPGLAALRLRPVPPPGPQRLDHESVPDGAAYLVAADGSAVDAATPQQVALLLAGHRSMLRRDRTKWFDWVLDARRARRDAAAELWADTTARTDGLVTAAAERLAGVEVALRPLSRPAALAITALLMCASFLTVSAILAAADVAPREAALLPLAFGPVFVLAVKTAVAAALTSGDPDRQPSGRARMVVALLPALVLAVAGLVTGVGLKSMALGSVLDDRVTSVSSLLLFAALALGELVGAAALALYQHCPGARAYEDARSAYRFALLAQAYAGWRHQVAHGRAGAAARQVEVRDSWRSGRGRVAVAAGWQRAVRCGRRGDGVLRQISLEPVRLALPASAAADPGTSRYVAAAVAEAPSGA